MAKGRENGNGKEQEKAHELNHVLSGKTIDGEI